jgi:methionyl-tRNA formyltransferase
MIAVARTPIDPDETAGALEDRLAALGAPLVATSIAAIEAGQAVVLPQDKSKVTRAPKLTKEDGLINWTSSAQRIHDLVRAMQPWPTASTTFRRPFAADPEPLRLIVHKSKPCPGSGQPGAILEASGDRLVVAASEGALQLLTVQVPGKKAMSAAEFLRGHKLNPGDQLGR